MRILHTSDWHLGHSLQDHTREYEHTSFLTWLHEILKLEHIDALIITGDVFDSANPSAQSQGMWYGFLAEAHSCLPRLDIVVIGGNHDSAARLDAPKPLLESLRVHVNGGLPYLDDGTIDWEQMIVPLHDHNGSVRCQVAAVPFLRQADLPPPSDDYADPLIDGVRKRYADAIEALRTRAVAGHALIVTGHCYFSGGILSELSERKILGGNQHALPADIFPDDITYVALGHLHLAQSVGGKESIRYSGSPIPLSVSEIHYTHQINIIDVDEGNRISIQQLPIPRPVDFLRIPAKGSLNVDQLLLRLEELPVIVGETDRNRWPFLEVSPQIDKPRPGLRDEILQALRGKAVRLVKISTSHIHEQASRDEVIGVRLDDISPEDVFVRCYKSRFSGVPPLEYISAFNELIHQVEQEVQG